MYDRRVDPDLEEEQLRRDDVRTRRRPGMFVADAVGGFVSGLLWFVLIAILVIALLIWVL